MLTPSGYTLHRLSGWLSLAGLALCFGSFIAVMSSVMMRHIGIRRDPLKPTETNSTATLVRYATPARRSLAAKLRSRLSTIRTRTKGESRYWPIAFSAFCCLGLVYAATRIPKYTVTEEHNVAVLGTIAPHLFRMHDDEQGDFRYRDCYDFPSDTIIKPGWVAPRARWEERGECRSIRATGLGFWWEYPDKSYREIIYGKDGKWSTQRWTPE
jgi:hypothetical protein